MMTRLFTKRLIPILLATLCAASSLAAAPVLSNGDFENNPPPNMGDNIGWSAAPWVIGGGVTANIIKVDGAGGYSYGSVPALEQDATNPGAGIAQHYLDVVGGTNSFYQPFTPLCSGEVTYGAAFSTVEGFVGDAGIEIQRDSDGSVVAPRQVTSLSGGNTASNPWSSFSFTTTLTANTTYRFVADLNDWVVMDNAFVVFNDSCPAHEDLPAKVNTTKTCAAPQMQADGSVILACEIEVDFPNGAPLDALGNVFPATISDTLTLNGAATATTMQGGGTDPWVCGPGFVPQTGGAQGAPAALSCVLDAASTATVASSSADGLSGMSVISTTTTFPAGSTGSVKNCAFSSYFPNPNLLIESPQSCVTVDLPNPHLHDPLPIPIACEAFSTEVTCDAASGKPVVTLKNKLSNLFNPSQINITSQTDGVTVTQSKANPLQILLTGAKAGDTVLLKTDAMAKGKGSQTGLDLCCEGPIKVEIPKGFTCEAKSKLEVSKTCDTDVKTSVGANAECEITVHYEGPKPSHSDPIVLTEAVTGSPWAFTTTPLSGDNWSCPSVPDGTPFTCTIDGAAEPAAHWDNWTSTMIVQMKAGDSFENCITAKTGGLEDRACWSTKAPKLTVEKTANQAQCVAGQPCDFTVTVNNTGTADYNGPVSMNDFIPEVMPALPVAAAGSFVAIAPPLCDVSVLNSFGLCSGQASIPAGGAQSYTVTWIPPNWSLAEGPESSQITNCVGMADANGSIDPVGSNALGYSNMTCATVTVVPSDITLTKTGPDLCLRGQACDYQVTISSTNGYNGPVLLTDDAPAGFEVTAITPAPVGCGANLPANPLACVIPASLSAGQSQTYTISITPNEFVMDSPSLGAENCAALRSVSEGASVADYSFAGDLAPEGLGDLLAGGVELGTSCAPVDWVVTPPPTDDDKLYVKKVVINNAPQSVDGLVFPISATCTHSPETAAQDNLANGETKPFYVYVADSTCTVTEGVIPATAACGAGMVDVWTTTYGPAQTVTLDPQGETVTVTNTLDCKPIEDTAAITISKTCAAPVAGPMGLDIDCIIKVETNGAPVPNVIQVTELLGQNLSPTDTGGQITSISSAEPWVYVPAPHPMATPVPMTLSGADMPASGVSVINVTMHLMNEGYLMETENCATLNTQFAMQLWGQPKQVCAKFSQPSDVVTSTKTSPALTVTKTSAGPCTVDEAAQTYGCDFDLTVANAGGDFVGPLVLGDAFDAGMVADATGQGTGWSCNSFGDAASCINGNFTLSAGASDAVQLSVTVKGLPEGGTFQNCASIGASEDPTQQAMIVQTALGLMGVDVGAIDGKPGKRTRAGVVDLQRQLGLAPTGEIDAALLTALGVPMANGAAPSCVTVDLPPMPRPRLICDKATTSLVNGACACRYKNMYQADDQTCGCVKGTSFVAGEGCIKRRVDKPKPVDPVKPKGVKCDAKTTVLRNGVCECREEGMRRKNATSCSRQKPRQELKLCPNGLPEIPGVGCLQIKLGGGGKKDDAPQDPVKTDRPAP